MAKFRLTAPLHRLGGPVDKCECIDAGSSRNVREGQLRTLHGVYVVGCWLAGQIVEAVEAVPGEWHVLGVGPTECEIAPQSATGDVQHGRHRWHEQTQQWVHVG